MLRRHIPLLTLTLLAAFALAASPAVAAPIPLINNYTCTDVLGTGATCTQDPGIAMDTDLTDMGTNFVYELAISGVVGTWDATITANDGTNEGSVTFSGIVNGSGPTILFDFSAFDTPGPAPVDFGSLDSMVLELKNTMPFGMDDSITVNLSAEVPEPGTAGMLMLGLFGLAAASPRKRIAA